MSVTLTDVSNAQQNMKEVVHVTPLDYSSTFSEFSKNDVYLKLENLQKTGSFKVRGSYNKLLSLTATEIKQGVIAASAGNHAQGVAYSAKMLGIHCTIVMPKAAPLSKIEATRRYGAEVVLKGGSFDDRIIEHGMVEAGRFIHFSTILKDKPGHLQEILRVISELEGNILSISLEHIGEKIFPGYAKLILSLETRDKGHLHEILDNISSRGYELEIYR